MKSLLGLIFIIAAGKLIHNLNLFFKKYVTNNHPTLIIVIYLNKCSHFLAYGTGEFSIVHHPGSIIFRGHDAVKQSTLPEVYSAALGFSTEHFSHWQGFYIENPFNIPEAIVTIAIDGVKDIGQNKGHHYPLLTNDDEGRIYRSLTKRISERFPNEEPTLIRIDLANGLEDVN